MITEEKTIQCVNVRSCWAEQSTIYGMRQATGWRMPVHHWSRIFEYPWIIFNGEFREDQWILDAGGGDGPLAGLIAESNSQVVVVDMESERIPVAKGILPVQGDLRQLKFQSRLFDRVVCVSVLEHIDDPFQVIKELWRVLKPGGRLLVTLDVASSKRWNHTVDWETAEGIMGMFGTGLPPVPDDILTATFPEIDPQRDEAQTVALKVLCFRCDKPWEYRYA